ncbi:MAG: PAS domain S-box protein [Prolixibacteraceae bacterium]|nr:PAS domain S-box protein [Prolixibacteraceae bacterium]
MQNIASELLLITTSLSTLKNKRQVINIFLESLNELFSGIIFHWHDFKDLKIDTYFPVATRKHTFGYIEIEGNLLNNPKQTAHLQNALQILAIILERLEQDLLLKKQRDELQKIVNRQTTDLLQKNKALGIANKELSKNNKTLKKLNKKYENEINRRKILEKKLYDSDKFFSHSIDMLCIAGFDGYFKMLNPAWEKTLGWSIKELLSKPWIYFVHPNDVEATNKIKSTIIDGHVAYQFVNRFIGKDGSVKWLSWNSFPHTKEKIMFGVARDITEFRQVEQNLKRIEWMLNPENIKRKQKENKEWESAYGDLTELNTNGLIKYSIEKSILHDLAGDYLTLLETSSAIYEKNGDYALGLFSSGWCRFLDNASRKLCNTNNNSEAINSGKWLCHESCWSDTSKKAMAEGRPVDIKCSGGINLYAVPIYAFGDIVGAINFGYGNPPTDEVSLNEIAKKYNVKVEELLELAKKYETRPPYIINLAKKRLKSSARLIGALVERKLIQDDLNKSEENALKSAALLEGVFDAIPDIIGVQDTNHNIISYNKAGYDLLNIKKGEEAGKKCFKLIGRKEPCNECASTLAIKTKKAAQIEKYVPEMKIWIEARSYPILDEKGEVSLIIEHLRDITDRKHAREKIQTLTQAIEQSPNSIIITNKEAQIEYINPIVEKISGYSKAELIGQNPRIFASGKTPEKIYREMWNTLLSGKIWQGEFQNRKKNGELYWESATISPVIDQKGNISNYLAIREDITERKRFEKELINAKEKAEESDRLKTSFLANMSHEIRTPMNSIMGFASLLPEEESRELMSQYANIIVSNSEQLVHIIDDIVLYSRLQTRLLSYIPTQFVVQELLTDVKQMFNLPEYQKTVELLIEPGELLSQKINTDYEKLRQIFTNLISNAFKYTLKGSITIGYKKIKNKSVFFVKDTGIGIPKGEEKRVFERFYRGSNVNKGHIGGTGLGLSIVQELIGLLNGEIWVESEKNKGSTFFIQLPNIMLT